MSKICLIIAMTVGVQKVSAAGPCEGASTPDGIQPPRSLDVSKLKKGDIIGFVRFMAQTSLVIQAVTGSPIDHVVIVGETAEGLRFYDVINERSGGKVVGMLPRKMTWEQLSASTQASPYWIVARANQPIERWQDRVLMDALEKVVAKQVEMPGSCSMLIRDALHAAGISVGYQISQGVDEFLSLQGALGAQAARSAFGGFPAKIWAFQLASTQVMVPNSSLFEMGAVVVDHSLPYPLEPNQHPAYWTLRQQWTTWSAIGDTKMLARAFYDSLAEGHPLKQGPRPDSETLDQIFRTLMDQWFRAESPAVLDTLRPMFRDIRP